MELTQLKGIGVKTQETFAKAGIFTIQDLLFFFPRDYEIFTEPTTISEIGYKTFATIRGAFTQGPSERRAGKLRISQATFLDEVGDSIRAVWFNAPFIKNSVETGVPYILRGRISRKYGIRQIDQPKIYRLAVYDNMEGEMQPVYPLTKGLTNNLLVRSVSQALETPEFLRIDEEEFIPEIIRKELSLCRRSYAVKNLHFPA